MKLESLKEVSLVKAKDIFLFDCRVAGLDSQTTSSYRHVLTSFVRFTGDILVKELVPDHVLLYIGNLSDGPSEGDEHTRTVINHYAVIHTWVRWLYVQKFLTERSSGSVEPPHLTDLFPLLSSTRDLAYCC
jgi:site-specific recombinase XerD